MFSTEGIALYLNRVIVSRFNNFMGERIDTIFDLPARCNKLSDDFRDLLQGDFIKFGLEPSDLYIHSITPPPEVQKAIDDKSRLGLFDDMNKLLKMKAAMAMESAATAQNGAGAGLGMGMGFMMPAMFADALKNRPETFPAGQAAGILSPGCRLPVSADAKFCPHSRQPSPRRRPGPRVNLTGYRIGSGMTFDLFNDRGNKNCS